jgi:RNA polymerase subunit RPABC4/transcription elongation factor Spt4
MKNFICTNCKYRFRAIDQNTNCPWCDKKEVAEEPSALDIVEEVERLLE